MSHPSRPDRRRVLQGAAGLGAAGLAAGFLAGEKPSTRDSATPQAAQAAHDEPIVAHVHDARTGLVDLFIGTRHVRVTDPELAAGLARAARPATA